MRIGGRSFTSVYRPSYRPVGVSTLANTGI